MRGNPWLAPVVLGRPEDPGHWSMAPRVRGPVAQGGREMWSVCGRLGDRFGALSSWVCASPLELVDRTQPC